MTNWRAYVRLLRLDKPVGILLLWFPTAWALWLANEGRPSFLLVGLFLIGTILMRSAGCVINDMADRKIDRHIARTQLRPLTTGEVSLLEAFVVLAICLTAALIILIQLPFHCVYWALLALLITVLYPFCKRWINAPQLVLGFAFSMGIPMAYIASEVDFNSSMMILFLINFAWIIVYDTIYAMVDKEDDLKIGVKSTAIYFGNHDCLIIGLLQFFLHGAWLAWALMTGVGPWFYGLWTIAGGILVYQHHLIRSRDPKSCFDAFGVSVYYGAIMWLAVTSISVL